MSLKARVNDDLKAALLGGDRFAVDTLRGLKAAILDEEIAKNQRDVGLDDGSIEQLIMRECKKREESAGLYDQGGNQAMADKERREKELLMGYLPQQLSEAELQAVVDTVVADLKPQSPADMGRVIGAVKARVGTTADGATIARLVKASL